NVPPGHVVTHFPSTAPPVAHAVQNVALPTHSAHDPSQVVHVNPSDGLTNVPAGQDEAHRPWGVSTKPGKQAEHVICAGVETTENEGIEQDVHVLGHAVGK
ncbi:hypothetical protein FRC07_006122, partial [Ceratobasidium sp. 392]